MISIIHSCTKKLLKKSVEKLLNVGTDNQRIVSLKLDQKIIDGLEYITCASNAGINCDKFAPYLAARYLLYIYSASGYTGICRYRLRLCFVLNVSSFLSYQCMSNRPYCNV